MSEDRSIINTGLRGVIVASTKISDVDGKAGKLIYRGYLAKDLAGQVSFEEVAHLLLFEKLPGAGELMEFKSQLAAERSLPDGLIAALKNSPREALPMDVLQSAVSMLAQYDPDAKQNSKQAAQRIAVRLIAKLPTIVAYWERIRNQKELIAPNAELSHAANFLYMLTGNVPDKELENYFDVALVLHAEHSFNASTFSARQVASTRAHMYAAVAAAIGSLSGALHGGANTRVMQMLMEIESMDKIEDYVRAKLASGGVIMGLGHAVYQTDDPRAHILAPMSKALGERVGDTKWYEMSKMLEQKGKQAFKEKKGGDIYVNVDFYSASLYYYMGIAVDLFTPVFAIARIAGWTSHVLEEQFAEAAPKPALYRPESDYVGEYCGPAECAFVPIDQR
jgi:citrate synthase